MNIVENMSEIEIRKKYLKAPSYDQIFGFIDELGVSYSQFERYYLIPYGVIRHVKRGVRNLPIKFWPIIYERIVPQYGMKYLRVTKFATTTKRVVKHSQNVAYQPDNDFHDRTGTLT